MPTLPSFLMSRRVLFIGAGICILIFILLIASSLSHPKEEPAEKKETAQTTYDKTTSRVFIKDFYKYGDYFTQEKQLAVENALYTYVRASTPDSAPDLYTGVIRQNSFLQTKDSSGTPTTRFLVDIGPVGVTYVLQVTGTIKNGPKPVLIQCAPKDQQQSTSVQCADGMQNRE